MEKIYKGYIEPIKKPTDRIYGNNGTPLEILQPDLDWTLFLPQKDDVQSNASFDSDNCTGEAMIHAIEIYLKRKYGEDNHFSPRALGIEAGTYPPGNDPMTVADAERNKGLIKDSSLPFDDTVQTVEQYYSPKPLTASLLVEEQQWHGINDFQYEFVFTNEHTPEEKLARLKECLAMSPLPIAVHAWSQDEDGLYYRPQGMPDVHFTTLYKIDSDNSFWVDDSYFPFRKHLRADFGFNFALRIYDKRKQKLPIIKHKTFFSFFPAWFRQIKQCV